MNLPLISIVTPSFNQGRFIRKTIDSVLAQNYANFEHIVIDGGSTDETIEILKSYSHLKWVSEPDRGQTHALNKGFAATKGDIVTWLNSDDWYAPNIFLDVAKALESSSVVMGACEFTDIDGKTTEVIPNIERNWFDILKYWIYYASPAQPSIFFTKKALEAVRLPNGNYLDEDLYYCMDFELWLRLAAKFPFTKRLDKTISYFRNYDENKSGKDMAASYREDSRAFKQHSLIASAAERRISFVVPITAITHEVEKTLLSIAHQSFRDVELLFIEYSGDRKAASKSIDAASTFDRDIPEISVRCLKSHEANICSAIQKGCESASAPIIAFLEPGTAVSGSFALDASNLFEYDFFGAAFPFAGREDLLSHYTITDKGRRMVSLDALLSNKTFGFNFIARKVALLELGGLAGEKAPALAIRKLFTRLLYKGWQISVENSLGCELPTGTPREDAHAARAPGLIAAKLICDIYDEFLQDPFAAVRIKHGFGFLFPEDSLSKARQLLSMAQPGWDQA